MEFITLNNQDITVYDGIVYFKDWLLADQGVTREWLKDTLVVEDASEDEIANHFENLEELFYDWCEENGVQGELV